jgi:hypothetical protein
MTERERQPRRPKKPMPLWILRPGDPGYFLKKGQTLYHGGKVAIPEPRPGFFLAWSPRTPKYIIWAKAKASEGLAKGYISKYRLIKLPALIYRGNTGGYQSSVAIANFLREEGWDVPPWNDYWAAALSKSAPEGVDGWLHFGELMLLQPSKFLKYLGAEPYTSKSPGALEAFSKSTSRRPCATPSPWWLLAVPAALLFVPSNSP